MIADSRRCAIRPFLILLLILAGLGIALPTLTPGLPPRAVVEIVPTNTNRPERCLTCHAGIEDMSASHPTAAFGCVSCHGGLPLATTADQAHAGMVVNPAALDVAQTSCGSCHPAQVIVVQRSLQATYAGAIGHVRRAFGLQPDDTARFGAAAIDHLQAFATSESDPAPIQSFAQNCLTCHLHSEALAQDYFYRSEGCAACHVLYANDGLYRGGDPTVPQDVPGHPLRHEFTLAISYTQCNHCHNRGNYDLRTMTFLQRDDLPAPEGLSDRGRRLHEYYQPIGQFTLCEWELDCIDCHTSREIMGDGVLYDNRAAASYIQCRTCHGTLDALPAGMVITETDVADLTRAELNPYVDLAVGDTVIATERGDAFWHVRQEGETWVLTGKADGARYVVPLVMGSACEQQPDQQASHYCHECHAYDRETPQP